MEPVDIPKTAITTPFGLFEFIVMPYDLRNVGQTFQRFIDSTLRGLDFCYCYLDDILAGMAEIQRSLNDFLKGPKVKGETLVIWTPEADAAFSRMKDSLFSDATMLAHPESDAPLSLTRPISL